MAKKQYAVPNKLFVDELTPPYMALLCVCDGFTLQSRNRAWDPPCSVEMYLLVEDSI